MLKTDHRIMMPRVDVADLKEELQGVLKLIMPTRPNTSQGIDYLVPSSSDVQNAAAQLQHVLSRFPFYVVGTKAQEVVTARRRREV